MTPSRKTRPSEMAKTSTWLIANRPSASTKYRRRQFRLARSSRSRTPELPSTWTWTASLRPGSTPGTATRSLRLRLRARFSSRTRTTSLAPWSGQRRGRAKKTRRRRPGLIGPTLHLPLREHAFFPYLAFSHFPSLSSSPSVSSFSHSLSPSIIPHHFLSCLRRKSEYVYLSLRLVVTSTFVVFFPFSSFAQIYSLLVFKVSRLSLVSKDKTMILASPRSSSSRTPFAVLPCGFALTWPKAAATGQFSNFVHLLGTLKNIFP